MNNQSESGRTQEVEYNSPKSEADTNQENVETRTPGSVSMKEMEVGSTVTVKTKNSAYVLEKRADGMHFLNVPKIGDQAVLFTNDILAPGNIMFCFYKNAESQDRGFNSSSIESVEVSSPSSQELSQG